MQYNVEHTLSQQSRRGSVALPAPNPPHGVVISVLHTAGGEDTEEVLGWASGAKYDMKKPELFGK